MTKAHERLDEAGDARLGGLLDAGDPNGDAPPGRQEVVRSLYEIDDTTLAGQFVDQLAADLQNCLAEPEIGPLDVFVAALFGGPPILRSAAPSGA